MTAAAIRAQIIETVSRRGGHLASSLGAVELAMALAKVFDPLRDRIVWDVGHQAYAWKILTGRAEKFGTLRTLGGVSGFPNPDESPADAAVAGHAGVALSVAEGIAAARDRLGGSNHVVAVVGDGSIVNGTAFEAMNNCITAGGKVILVLNDNEMSISRPAGSFARFLGRLIAGVRYNRVKAAAEKAGHRLRLTFLRRLYHGIETHLKSLFLGNRYFEQFGLRYVGPVDGHDLAALEAALTVAKEDKRSVVVHVYTVKGKGFAPAERDPTRWHGASPFDPAAALAGRAQTPAAAGWSEVFGASLCRRAAADSRLVALTAGMKDGTGLAGFAAAFPQRFFDVGISEGHMVAFAAGLAAGGMRPVVAVYSTFLQRAVDQIMHDVCLPRLPVVFCVDRSGVVGSDGPTHHGVYDLAMLRCLPGLTICEPCDIDDFETLLDEAFARPGPTVIRYPRGTALRNVSSAPPVPPQPRVAIWATGDWYAKAQAVAAAVGGVAVHARYLKPLDTELLARQRAAGMAIASLENAAVAGGLGEALGADLKLGWPDEFVPAGSCAELERKYALDTDGAVRRLREFLDGRGAAGMKGD